MEFSNTRSLIALILHHSLLISSPAVINFQPFIYLTYHNMYPINLSRQSVIPFFHPHNIFRFYLESKSIDRLRYRLILIEQKSNPNVADFCYRSLIIALCSLFWWSVVITSYTLQSFYSNNNRYIYLFEYYDLFTHMVNYTVLPLYNKI